MTSDVSAASFEALGTTAWVLAPEGPSLAAARAAVEREIAAVDRACSRFRDDSDLAAVNRAEGRATPVSPVFLEALDVALRAARLTDGLVDPTIGAVLRSIGYDRDFGDVAPDGPPLRATVRTVPGWRAITVDPEAGTVRVPAGVALDLGATAKAWCADRAAAAAFEATGAGVLVSLGGDIAVAGPPPAEGWAVRVTDDHRSPTDAPGQTVIIRAGGLATSSTSVRRWTRGDRPLHHLIDPVTGAPVDSGWRTVSVAAASCADANTASTAAIILGRRAPAWLAGFGLPARLVAADGTVTTVGDWPADDVDDVDDNAAAAGDSPGDANDVDEDQPCWR